MDTATHDDHTWRTHVTAIHESDLAVEEMLGKGGFCEVRQARANTTTMDTNKKYAVKYL